MSNAYNEFIEFKRPVNSLVVESRDNMPLKIQVNDMEDKWYVSGGTQEGLNGLRINKMTILEDAGAMIKWKALTY